MCGEMVELARYESIATLRNKIVALLRMQLADDFLIYGDKISMSSSLEMRVPMLDIQLVSFIKDRFLSNFELVEDEPKYFLNTQVATICGS